MSGQSLVKRFGDANITMTRLMIDEKICNDAVEDASTGYSCSVLIATLNMSQYLGTVIDSCVSSLRDCEVIVVDDGSTDGTAEYIQRRYAANSHIRYFRFERNIGKVAAFNYAYSLSSGRTITLIGADDKILPGRQVLVDTVLSNDEIDVAVGDTLIADDQLTVQGRYSPPNMGWPGVLHGNPYPGGTMVLRRRFAETVFPLPNKLSNEDYIISLVACLRGCARVIHEDVAIYRRHKGSTWGALSEQDGLRRDAARACEIFQYFAKSYGPFTDVDMSHLRRAIRERRAIAGGNLRERLSVFVEIIWARYPLRTILLVMIGANSYVTVRRRVIQLLLKVGYGRTRL